MPSRFLAIVEVVTSHRFSNPVPFSGDLSLDLTCADMPYALEASSDGYRVNKWFPKIPSVYHIFTSRFLTVRLYMSLAYFMSTC